MIQPEQVVGAEWAEWYRLSPSERWLESERLLAAFLMLGGSLDPEPDTQSPFFDSRALLMGGQACVLYGAAEFSRDTDVLIFKSGQSDTCPGSVLDARASFGRTAY